MVPTEKEATEPGGRRREGADRSGKTTKYIPSPCKISDDGVRGTIIGPPSRSDDICWCGNLTTWQREVLQHLLRSNSSCKRKRLHRDCPMPMVCQLICEGGDLGANLVCSPHRC
ncbi:hypothetical protein Dimus_001829 [Dionaea muscipula]